MCSVLIACTLFMLLIIKLVNVEAPEVVQVEKIPIEPVKVMVEEPVIVEKPQTPEEIIIQVAEENGIAPSLMLALAEVESGFNFDAVSKTGDHGVMQINERNHEWLEKELGITDWLDVRQNTEAACFIINWLRANYKDCEDVSCCLMAYNMGIGNARKLWEQGIYESEYSKKVLELEFEIGGKLYEKTTKN